MWGNLQDNSRIKVRISYAIVDDRKYAGQLCCVIEAVNIGNDTVTLEIPRIEISRYKSPPKHELILMPHGLDAAEGVVRFPHVLEPGKSWTVWIGIKQLAQIFADKNNYAPGPWDEIPYTGKVIMTCVYRDNATGELYRSNEIDFDIDAWLNNKA